VTLRASLRSVGLVMVIAACGTPANANRDICSAHLRFAPAALVGDATAEAAEGALFEATVAAVVERGETVDSILIDQAAVVIDEWHRRREGIGTGLGFTFASQAMNDRCTELGY